MFRTWLVTLALCFSVLAEAKEPLLWTGVDFGEVRMCGTGDFRDATAIFPGYLNKWNVLLLDEQLDNLESRLKRDIIASTSHLTPLHNDAEPSLQILRDDLRSHDEAFLSAQDVARRVTLYELPTSAQGLALVFIADVLNKPTATGCYWVTFYDAQTRQIYQTERMCGRAAGLGFRNYWFGTIKSVIKQLRRI